MRPPDTTDADGGPWLAPSILMAAILVLAAAFGLYAQVPVLGEWEHFQYAYMFAATEPFLSWEIGPRANTGGQGYPLVDLAKLPITLFGYSLGSFRAINQIYALVAIVAMAIALGRWHGRTAACIGVGLTAISTGFVIFANQTLVAMPSLMLAALLVERSQIFDRGDRSHLLRATLGLIAALLLIHYAMGRFFLLGWFLYSVAKTALETWRGAPDKESYLRQLKTMARDYGIVILWCVVWLAVLDIDNLAPLLRPVDLFFPNSAPEVEFSPMALPETIAANVGILAELLFPLPLGRASVYPEALLAVGLYPLFNLWHLPLFAIGIVVSARHTFVLRREKGMPYLSPEHLSLHMIFILTIGLSLFSERFETTPTFPATRIFLGILAIAGYMTVGAAWVIELWNRHAPVKRGQIIAAVAGIAVALGGAAALQSDGQAHRERVASRASLTVDGAAFTPMPSSFPYGIWHINFLEARFDALAKRLAAHLTCRAPIKRPRLVEISPDLLLDRGVYHGIHYIKYVNDLSAVLALYLGSHGLDASFVIVHGADDAGTVQTGHSYRGRPRVFSGPIEWRDGEIVYRPRGAVRYDLKSPPGEAPPTIIAFSAAEAGGAIKATTPPGPDRLVIRTLRDLSDLPEC